jgi:two-component system, chemotaxis family, protein-glutamate methylesterase/glutaminase
VPNHGIVVVGASAGGVEALKEFVRGLAPDLPAAVFVVLHHGAATPNVLPSILSRSGPLPTTLAWNGGPIEVGQIYVAPSDVHLLVNPGETRLSHAPRENGVRPAIDPLFRSAAQAYGPEVIGVVLSGSGDDGTVGLADIKARGGIAIVQSPTDALFPSMPRSAAEHVDVDFSVPMAQMGELVSRLAGRPTPQGNQDCDKDRLPLNRPVRVETDGATGLPTVQHRGQLIPFVCPACGGPLWEERNLGLARFVCLIGHSLSSESLYVGKTAATEAALWAAVRALDERADLARRLARRMGNRNTFSRHHFEDIERESKLASDVIRQLLRGGTVTNESSEAEAPAAEEDRRG